MGVGGGERCWPLYQVTLRYVLHQIGSVPRLSIFYALRVPALMGPMCLSCCWRGPWLLLLYELSGDTWG